jgi:Uma2 family endonuclease
MVITHRTTLEEFMALPSDEFRHELVRGVIVSMPPPKGEHGFIELAVASAIDRYLIDRASGLGWHETNGRQQQARLVGRVAVGEVGVRLRLPDDNAQVRGLDVAYFTPEQVARLGEILITDYAPEMPALAAEIISPSETAEYVDEKVTDYIAGGARLIWLVYPRTRRVKVVTPDGTVRTVAIDGVLDGGDILQGFTLKVIDLFS